MFRGHAPGHAPEESRAALWCVAFRALAAPDKFRGTISAREAAASIGRAAAELGWCYDLAPVSDGGEGFLDVLSAHGARMMSNVVGPLGEPVEVPWVLGPDPERPERQLAVVESAHAIGLQVVGGPEANDPVAATSAGAGQLIAEAFKAGAAQVLVGLGGSATTDGGLGAVEALAPDGRVPEGEILVACDVETRFTDAAAVFGPQKGATPEQVEFLAERLGRVAELYRERFGIDVRGIPGGGAAGGLAGGLVAVGAKLVPGFDIVAEKLSLAKRVTSCDVVVTGEGRVDLPSFAGKAVGGLARLAGPAGVPVLVVAGEVVPEAYDAATCSGANLTLVSLVARFGEARARSDTAQCLHDVVAEQLSHWPPAARS